MTKSLHRHYRELGEGTIDDTVILKLSAWKFGMNLYPF